MKREKYEQAKRTYDRIDAIDAFLKVLENDDMEKFNGCFLQVTVPSSASLFHGASYTLGVSKTNLDDICKIFKEERDRLQSEMDSEW